MATTDERPYEGALRSALIGVGSYDAILSVGHTIVMLTIGFADVRVAVLTTVLRMAILLFMLTAMLAPLRSLQGQRAGKSGDVSVMRRAETALRRLGPRFSAWYVVLWVVCQSSWFALAWFGIPEELPVGSSELVTLIIIVISHVMSLVLLPSILEAALASIHGRLRRELSERGLDV
ncbi:MAG: hypothetical protein KC431_15390, partial [Myxococcales bacterium]|nr:hypothetical protein [Myxococcales bacterium]